MKKVLILILMMILAIPVMSQENNNANDNEKKDDNVKTLFGSDEFRSGGYGGPEIKFTPIKGDMGILVGGRGGWIVNSTLSLGLGGYGLVTNHKVYSYPGANGSSDTSYYLRMGYGGFIIEYINSSDNLVHFTVNTLIGGGGASNTRSLKSAVFDNNYNNSWVDDASAFFVLEPAVTVDINVTKFFRIGFGASYRMVTSLDLKQVSNKDISGLSGNIILKFGKF